MIVRNREGILRFLSEWSAASTFVQPGLIITSGWRLIIFLAGWGFTIGGIILLVGKIVGADLE